MHPSLFTSFSSCLTSPLLYLPSDPFLRILSAQGKPQANKFQCIHFLSISLRVLSENENPSYVFQTQGFNTAPREKGQYSDIRSCFSSGLKPVVYIGPQANNTSRTLY